MIKGQPSPILLSCVIPARNEFPQICFTIYSILHCWENDGFDPKEIEIIVVDNGSDDDKYPQRGTAGTTSYLEGRSIYWNAVLRVLRFPICGNHAARNKGGEIARGKYLFFSDAHMAYQPGFFKEILRTVDESGGLVHGCIAWMGAYPITPQGTGYSYTIKLGEEWKGCVDEKTELLTRTGWKKWNEVDMETEFATVNTKTKEIEFQKPKDIVIREHDGLMYKFSGRSVDALLTPYHRCPYISQYQRGKRDDTWREKRAEEIKSFDYLPLATAGTGVKKAKYPDYLVELIGWIITEGHYYKKPKDERITIVQYDKKNRKRIINAVKKFGYSWHLSTRGDICIAQFGSRKIFKILPEKKLTFDFLNQLSRSQLELLYKTLLDGDGTRQPTNETFIQKNTITIDAFQYLCILIGRQSRKYTRQPSYFKGNRFSREAISYVSVKKNEYTNGFKIEKVKYKGKVWCPELPNGTIFMRRNGKTMPSFQTWNNYYLADDWWYIPAQGHCSVAVRKDQFFKFGGYPKIHRTYGGGEFYLDMKWWMFGSTVAINPKAIGFHLASGRGYSYKHDDYIQNVLGVTYALGCDDWRERTYINWLRHHRKEVLDMFMARGEKEYAPDRAFVEKNRKKTFNELLVEKPWDKLNMERHGKCNGAMTVFHPSWLELLQQAPEYVKVAYREAKYQKKLEEFIKNDLWEFVYKKENYDKENLPKV